jgi:hypothetical protein
MFDDNVELDSSAAVELEKALQKQYKPSKQARTGGRAMPVSSSAFATVSFSKMKANSSHT